MFKAILLVFIFSSFGKGFADMYTDVKLIQSTTNADIYELQISDINFLDASQESNTIYKTVSFKNAYFADFNNEYMLPSRILNFGIPQDGNLSVQVLSKSEKVYKNIHIKKQDYQNTENISPSKKELIEITEKKRFRDIMMQAVVINAASYNSATQTLTITDKIQIKVNFSGSTFVKADYKTRGKLDNLYQKSLLNFEQAKKWQIKRSLRLNKLNQLTAGTYYSMTITEDGIYKITASTLRNAGIETDFINIDALQMYNNGGVKLSLATTSEQFNPPYTQEIPILIFDQNNNNLFDANDYLLFYGKGINGWFYDSSKNDFIHQMHPYDIKNMYFLSVTGNSGKRMEANNLNDLSGTLTQNYFLDRFHFEDDKYNLLNSGPDWYGHRFFGRSGSHSIDFEIKSINAGIDARFDVRFKGGSGVKYLDNKNYTYYFDIDINNNRILNQLVFGTATRYDRATAINPALLNDGQNAIKFNYTSNEEGSSVHLDYFNLVYARPLTANQNYLNFYSDPAGTNRDFVINGFTNTSDVYVFDVTDPINSFTLRRNVPTSGTIQLNIPAEWEHKNIIVTSLNSPAIKSISKLVPYNANGNLLDPAKSADFIIVTSKSLTQYGDQIAELRDHLKTEVVSLEDIYFYFNSGVQDPTAIRNFARYAYYNWQTPTLSYILLFGDGHYDYRNISVSDSIVVPTFQIYGLREVNFGTSESRESDLFFAQIENSSASELQSTIIPSIAIGRLPVENALDAERMVEKLKTYKANPVKDGWQTVFTLVGDDEKVQDPNRQEWLHQSQAETLSKRSELKKFNMRKIYLSGFEDIPGGRRILKPEATQALIDQINRGTLILNYIGHGSPTTWAHETVFNFERDYNKINNEGRLPFIVAATCDFGLFDNPNEVSFAEALIWKEKSGTIGVLAATRLVYSGENAAFNNRFYANLFPSGEASVPLGEAFMLSISTSGSRNVNDQKYHLLADPSMTLVDAREEIEITSISPDTLKALSQVNIKGKIKVGGQYTTNFSGGAILQVNDAKYEDVNTGGNGNYNYDLQGPLIFKGEVSVDDGELEGNFIVPKSIRYKNKNNGSLSLYAWDEETNLTAGNYTDNLLFLGSSSLNNENEGPEIDIYFEGQENFTSGDIVSENPILMAEVSDESGINMTGQLGHKIELRIDDEEIIDISESFSYYRDSFTKGAIHYPITNLTPGEHSLTLQAYDNLNNLSERTVQIKISQASGLILADVVNYPNPFKKNTDFTFQTNADGAEVTIKIYTISGRLIEKLEGFVAESGYNEIPWNGLDRDGNTIANGVYLYKIILKSEGKSKEKIEKLVVIQ